MTAIDDKTFYAKAVKGFIPKTTFDSLATSASRITMKLKKNGIFIRQPDCDDIRWSHMLWDVDWPRKNFATYKCKKEYCIMINAKNLQKMLRNVKKKDSLSFFISGSDETQLGLAIQPSGAATDGPASRAEIVYLSVQHVEDVHHDLPEMYENDKNKLVNAYGQPIIIGATDFQKIKKMSGTVPILTVRIQRGNYIAFLAGENKVMRTELTFGELETNPESEEDEDKVESEEEETPKKKGKKGKKDNKNKKDKKETAKDVTATAVNNNGGSIYPNVYEKDFTMTLFVPLVKLPGLTTQMEFYAPKIDHFPLKISMSATSGLGNITVFVKDQSQIAIDENKKRQEPTSTPQTKNKKSKDVK